MSRDSLLQELMSRQTGAIAVAGADVLQTCGRWLVSHDMLLADRLKALARPEPTHHFASVDPGEPQELFQVRGGRRRAASVNPRKGTRILPLDVVQRCVDKLEAAGLIARRAERYHPVHALTVDTRAASSRGRESMAWSLYEVQAR